jgi:hypothetical protein
VYYCFAALVVVTEFDMAPSTTPNITRLLIAWNQGDHDARARLSPLVYRELRRLANGYLAGELCLPIEPSL